MQSIDFSANNSTIKSPPMMRQRDQMLATSMDFGKTMAMSPLNFGSKFQRKREMNQSGYQAPTANMNKTLSDTFSDNNKFGSGLKTTVTNPGSSIGLQTPVAFRT